ncbi:unnamed protein product [Protopolystoma xenopodis]|uniref:Uncharacterized protein n=1 Tax=Protopolystoma xenopodis TaxID=117903 RepID=A0A3S5BVE0_9PLAT|nr:unnamed protein product [Protopolystoma xenopodis]
MPRGRYHPERRIKAKRLQYNTNQPTSSADFEESPASFFPSYLTLNLEPFARVYSKVNRCLIASVISCGPSDRPAVGPISAYNLTPASGLPLLRPPSWRMLVRIDCL